MKKIFFFFICSFTSLLAESSFIAINVDTNDVFVKEGDLETRVSPCSTFKIPLSLIGYDAPLLQDATNPEWVYMDIYKTWNGAWLDVWSKPHNPTSWIKHSCIWYSQLLTQQIGMQRLQQYVAKFDYGNQDLNGEPGKSDGLTHSWLSSTLKISPKEQAIFLKKLLKNQLPVTEHAHKMTKAILYAEELPNGWKLYGKTGSGYHRNAKGKIDLEKQLGWFVGWIERPQGTLVFAYLLQDTKKENSPAGKRAKIAAKERVLKLAPTLEQGSI